METKTSAEPSGASVGCASIQRPENGARRGVDQPAGDFVDTRIAPSRENTTVAPSGVRAASASLDGPEITPGAKISGGGACAAAIPIHPAPSAQATRPGSDFMTISS